MKKTLTIAAAALISASAFAQTVTSANIVGYSKTDLTASQIKILAPQFPAANTNGVTLADAFSGVVDLSKVHTWDGTQYASYLYSSVGGGWFDAGTFAPADNVLIEQGDAVWLENGATTTNVVMSGDVPADASIDVTVVAGINMVANPYPVKLALVDIPNTFFASADKIHVWDGSTYTSYLYNGGNWYNAGTFALSNDVTIDVGQGFWLEVASGGTLTFNKQY
jgi:hypothetical protein